jgi:hypothetical protein
MATGPGAMYQLPVSLSPAVASTGVSTSGQPQRDAPRHRISASLPAWRGFSGGFVGGLIGGLIYCLVLAWFQNGGLELACLRALALSLILGGFEMWRVTRGRRSKRVAVCLLWTLAASGLVFWALGAVLPGKERSRPETPPQITHSRLALI